MSQYGADYQTSAAEQWINSRREQVNPGLQQASLLLAIIRQGMKRHGSLL
jgi:hypothetical protein